MARRRELAARAVDLTAAQLRWARPAVAVTGFWRSGTTWLQQSLAATLRGKSIFEPLSPDIPGYAALLGRFALGSRAARHAFVPFLDTTTDAATWRYLDRAFAGSSQGGFALLSRRHVHEAFRRDVVVKCVRMSFGQSAVHERYGVPVIHLRRHPCAVVASLLQTRWSWSFEDVRLADILAPLDIEARRSLEAQVPELEHGLLHHDRDAISRIAAFWAITERYVDQRLNGRPWAQILTYERLGAHPKAVMGELCGFFGRPRDDVVVTGDSPVTETASAGLRPQMRIDAWRGQLPANSIARVRAIVTELFPGYDMTR